MASLPRDSEVQLHVSPCLELSHIRLGSHLLDQRTLCTFCPHRVGPLYPDSRCLNHTYQQYLQTLYYAPSPPDELNFGIQPYLHATLQPQTNCVLHPEQISPTSDSLSGTVGPAAALVTRLVATRLGCHAHAQLHSCICADAQSHPSQDQDVCVRS
ncbi:hypothetical protein BJV78DRAFT_725951 [Lactifluus subvellereus]|nr:hypothetical protein BJV78DRAFT_725951 [Lactifluus subvellereus]